MPLSTPVRAVWFAEALQHNTVVGGQLQAAIGGPNARLSFDLLHYRCAGCSMCTYTHHVFPMTSPALAAVARLHAAKAPASAPATTHTALPADFDPYAQQRVDFGKLLTAWMTACSWSQDTFGHVSRAAGHGHMAVHNSQLSRAQNGILDPKPKFFACLADCNALIADQSWIHRDVPTSVRVRLMHAIPMTDADGRVWDALDFFAAFAGVAR